MEIELTKKQQRRVNHNMKKAEKKITDIKREHLIIEDTNLVDKYIFQRKLVITVARSILKDVFEYIVSENSIFLDKEDTEIIQLTSKLYHKIIEIDDKIEDIYINFIRTEKWMKRNCRDLANKEE